MVDENVVAKVVEENLRQLSQEIMEMLMEKITIIKKAVEGKVQPVGVSAPGSVGLANLRQSITNIRNVTSQLEITSTILKEATKFASRAAVFVVKPDRVQGWETAGLDSKDPSKIRDFKKVNIPLEDPSGFKEVIETRKPVEKPYAKGNISNYLMIQMGGKKPKQSFFAPLIMWGKIIAILYADCLENDEEKFSPETLDILSQVASTTMEIISTGKVSGKPKPEKEIVEPAQVAEETKVQHDESTETAEPIESSAPVVTEEPADTMSPELMELHEKAKRTARVIVSDIVLYNKAKIEDGLTKGNLQDVLKEEIERGKELYFSKIPPELADATDYFTETLIQTVAKGDPALLGL